MKVRLVMTVDIDPEAWASEFGVATNDVREDVKVYCEVTVLNQLARIGLAPSLPSGAQT